MTLGEEAAMAYWKSRLRDDIDMDQAEPLLTLAASMTAGGTKSFEIGARALEMQVGCDVMEKAERLLAPFLKPVSLFLAAEG